MFGNSRPVDSAQTAPHPRLAQIVQRHLRTPFRKPPAAHSLAAYAMLRERVASHAGGCILDAGCGTGIGTIELARRHPGALVIGVDQSEARLRTASRNHAAAGHCPDVHFVRADVVDVLGLAASDRVVFEQVWLLYPNPWPKHDHVQRRWHGHPVLPALLSVATRVELRTNWRVYADEFAQALTAAGREVACEPHTPVVPMTAFERKYAASGHALWRVAVAPPS
jgi:tRNA G46 methylase TrmB